MGVWTGSVVKLDVTCGEEHEFQELKRVYCWIWNCKSYGVTSKEVSLDLSSQEHVVLLLFALMPARKSR